MNAKWTVTSAAINLLLFGAIHAQVIRFEAIVPRAFGEQSALRTPAG
jgi:hypothetical protein